LKTEGRYESQNASVTHLALLQHGEPLVTRLLEERRADLAAVAVQQVDAEQSALALGIRPAADVGLGGDTRLDRPSNERLTTALRRETNDNHDGKPKSNLLEYGLMALMGMMAPPALSSRTTGRLFAAGAP
jgi:hypothetical protein